MGSSGNASEISICGQSVCLAPHSCALCWTRAAPTPGGQEKVASVTDTREYQHRKKNLMNYSFIAFLTIDHKAVAYSGDAHDHRGSITGRSASCVSS